MSENSSCFLSCGQEVAKGNSSPNQEKAAQTSVQLDDPDSQSKMASEEQHHLSV